MAKPNRMRPIALQADADTVAALSGITGYKPSNSKYSAQALSTALKTRTETKAAETKAESAYKAARDAAAGAEFNLHELVLGARDQVVAQFGRDSDQAASMGLKKKSERRRPVRKPAPSGS